MWNEKFKRLRQNEKKQTITISVAAGNYDTEIIIDLINQAIQDFRVKYQESSIGFQNLACIQSIENECNQGVAAALFSSRRPKNLQNDKLFLHLEIAEIDMGVNFGSKRTILDTKTHF